jgi:hypothetical protein
VGKILHLSFLWENAYYGLVFGNTPHYGLFLGDFRNLGRLKKIQFHFSIKKSGGKNYWKNFIRWAIF